MHAFMEGGIIVYVDAQQDLKSQMVVIIYVGDTLVYMSSKRQKCKSKSPTKAELIGLMDNLGLI
jgi:hypothetical protein